MVASGHASLGSSVGGYSVDSVESGLKIKILRDPNAPGVFFVVQGMNFLAFTLPLMTESIGRPPTIAGLEG